MRTTLTLEPDVALRVRQEVRRRGKSMKAVVNDGLRAGLGRPGRRAELPAFKVIPRRLGLQPGVDPDRMNQLADELEVEAFLERNRR
jgi:hypothetical protein